MVDISTAIGEAFQGIKNQETNRVLAIPQVNRATELEKPQSPALDSAYALLPQPQASCTVGCGHLQCNVEDF
jgi:hypothetical protein